MNKIIKELLKSKFANADVDAILEVINVSPNAQIATEILCGLYEEPIVKYSQVESKNEGILTFVKYDKWNDKVTYTYYSEDSRGAYFPKGTQKSDVNMDNFESMKVSSSTSGAEYLYIPTGQLKKCTSTMYLETWNNSVPVEELVSL